MNNDSIINSRIDVWKERYDKLNFYIKVRPHKLKVNDLCMIINPFDTTMSPSRFIIGVVKQKFNESILMQTYTEVEIGDKAPLLINAQYNQLYIVSRRRLEED